MNLLQAYAAVGKVTLTPGKHGELILSAPAGSVGAGARFAFDGAARDWSAGGARSLSFTLHANGAHRLRFHLEHDRGTWTFYVVPRPGLTSRVVVAFDDLVQRPPNTNQPGCLVFGGGPQPTDLSDVRALSVTFNQVSPEEKEVTLGDMTLSGDSELAPALLDPRVVVDAWGQWTGERGKPRTEAEIRTVWAREPATFAGFPGHTNETGADAAGDVIASPTGFFRVAEHAGRWWLVDPDGRPFFSAGCDCVSPHAAGPVGGRESLFADLTDAQWRGTNTDGSPWSNPRWADFYNRNVRRRHEATGHDWHEPWSRQTATRLRAWGFNTIANWSDPVLTRRGLLPYTTNLASLAPFCGHLPDVFSPDFAQKVRALVEPEVAPYIGDKMLIGYFVGNEPHWTFGGHRHPFGYGFYSVADLVGC